MSATTLPRSRPAVLHWTMIRRRTFSRLIVFGPLDSTTWATALNGIWPPRGSSMDSRRNCSGSSAERIVQPDGQIELPFALHDLGDHAAVHRRFDQFVHVVGVQPVPREGRPIQVDPQLRNFDLLLDHQVLDAGHVLDGRLHLVGFRPQHVEVVAVELDADLGLHAGEHLRR